MNVFISSRLRAPTKEEVRTNITVAENICKSVYRQGYVPLCPNVYLPRFLEVGEPKAEAFAAKFSELLLAQCDELWVYDANGISEGMKAEIEYAEMFVHCPIKYFTKGEWIL